jgi:CDP-diacylglycerol--glycerol-3-phosphate 3-phosphatidyltransferase/cardiolipin synthase
MLDSTRERTEGARLASLMGIPNLLTLLRIGLVPIFVLVFYLPFRSAHIATAAIFALAAVTDWLDGFLARKLGLVSALGAFLDPVADKLMVAVALVLLVQTHPTAWFALPAAVIVGREIIISGLREWMAEIGKRTSVAVSIMGKFKTGSQMLALILLLYREPIAGLPITAIGFVLLYLAAGLTLWSMIIYLRAAWPGLVSK